MNSSSRRNRLRIYRINCDLSLVRCENTNGAMKTEAKVTMLNWSTCRVSGNDLFNCNMHNLQMKLLIFHVALKKCIFRFCRCLINILVESWKGITYFHSGSINYYQRYMTMGRWCKKSNYSFAKRIFPIATLPHSPCEVVRSSFYSRSKHSTFKKWTA